jgi:regulator of protease activity HflC (stomatin/prohibitin superfamily)
MDTSSVLLILFVAIAAVFTLMATMIHIVRPGEIGFVYRRGTFLRLIEPGRLVMVAPIIFRIHRMKTESLHIVVESSAHRAQLQLGIADPSRVPVTVEEVESETRNRASELVLRSLSRYGSDKNHLDTTAAAKEIENRLNTILRDIGLKVESLKMEPLSERRP